MKKVPFLIDILATALYLGKAPFMPGTFGSLMAIPIAYLVRFQSIYVKLAIFSLIFAVGVFVSDKYAKITGVKDPSSVVIDEVAGFFIFFIVFPFKPIYVIGGFLLFRFFDILKPFPVKLFEKFSGGWGIMLDDIIAGFYAILVFFIFEMIMRYFNIHF